MDSTLQCPSRQGVAYLKIRLKAKMQKRTLCNGSRGFHPQLGQVRLLLAILYVICSCSLGQWFSLYGKVCLSVFTWVMHRKAEGRKAKGDSCGIRHQKSFQTSVNPWMNASRANSAATVAPGRQCSIMVKSMGGGEAESLGWDSYSALAGCATLGKLLNLSEPQTEQTRYWKNNDSNFFRCVTWGLWETSYKKKKKKGLSLCLTHNFSLKKLKHSTVV